MWMKKKVGTNIANIVTHMMMDFGKAKKDTNNLEENQVNVV